MNAFIVKLTCICLIVLAYPTRSMSEASFIFSESSINSGPSDWLGLDESQVFYKKLTHTENGHSWVIKVGKGGQLYSIQIPELGELIAFQRAEHGQWIDEVFQHTLPMPPQKSKSRYSLVVDGDIHQAGYYTVSDLDNKVKLLPRSVYSPVFSYQSDPVTNSVSYITWPQHAHLPRRYAENLALINQTIKDMGGGVIEISLEFNKWGGARHEKLTLPWAAFRTRTLPEHIISDVDGSYREANQELSDRKLIPRLQDRSTGGWTALVSSKSPLAQGIGIIYGKDPNPLGVEGGIVTWGTYGPPQNPQIGGTVMSVYRNVSLDVGETLFYRYYLVLGTLANIQMKANELESKVELYKITRTQEKVNRLEVCQDVGKALTRTCAKDEKPLFSAFKDFIPNAKPLFLLQYVGTGKFMVTDNPYEISFNPTDGSTMYTDLLGWAVPKSMAVDSCRYQPLSEAVDSMKSQPKLGQYTAGLYVLRTTEAVCPNTPHTPPARPRVLQVE